MKSFTALIGPHRMEIRNTV